MSGNGQVIITFTPGAGNGSSITNYEYSVDGVNYTALDPATTGSPITIPGLTNGTEYSITLRALNGNGEGAVSVIESVTAGLPAAPTIDFVVEGNAQATVTFTPGEDNGSPITGYRYIKDDGSSTSSILGTTGAGYANDITVDAAGNVYTANDSVCVNNDCQTSGNVWKITPDGVSSILATVDGELRGIAVDAAGNVYGRL